MEYGSTSYEMAQFLHTHATTLGLEFYQTSWLNITNKQSHPHAHCYSILMHNFTDHIRSTQPYIATSPIKQNTTETSAKKLPNEDKRM